MRPAGASIRGCGAAAGHFGKRVTSRTPQRQFHPTRPCSPSRRRMVRNDGPSSCPPPNKTPRRQPKPWSAFAAPANIPSKPNAFREFPEPFVPKGHRENSPAFQRREETPVRPSPEGTAELSGTFSAVPSGLVLHPLSPSVKTPGYFHNVPAGRRSNSRKALRLSLHPPACLHAITMPRIPVKPSSPA